LWPRSPRAATLNDSAYNAPIALLNGGRSAVRRSGLGFLGTSRFAAKTLGFGGCKSLDFLGFSRPNLDLSMGYTSFSAEDFSTALLSSRKRRRNGGPTIPHAGVMGEFMGQA
jgi:hypothetical protein